MLDRLPSEAVKTHSTPLHPQHLEPWWHFLGSTPVSALLLPSLETARPSHTVVAPSPSPSHTPLLTPRSVLRSPAPPHATHLRRCARSDWYLGVHDGWPPTALGPVGRDGFGWEQTRRRPPSLAWSPLPAPPALGFTTAAWGSRWVSPDVPDGWGPPALGPIGSLRCCIGVGVGAPDPDRKAIGG